MRTGDELICEGKHLRFLKRGGWEMVSRKNISGIVGIIAVTDDGKLLLVEQHRPPVDANVIEIPAGLAGDVAGSEHEELAIAAMRELLEETGYEAGEIREVGAGTSSAGICDELITLFMATKLVRKEDAHGDGSEKITLHEVPLAEVRSFLAQKIAHGARVDLKVYSSLYFAQHELAPNYSSRKT